MISGKEAHVARIIGGLTAEGKGSLGIGVHRGLSQGIGQHKQFSLCHTGCVK